MAGSEFRQLLEVKVVRLGGPKRKNSLAFDDQKRGMAWHGVVRSPTEDEKMRDTFFHDLFIV